MAIFEKKELESQLQLPDEFRPTVDVVVVGAGIAGLIAARKCAGIIYLHAYYLIFHSSILMFQIGVVVYE